MALRRSNRFLIEGGFTLLEVMVALAIVASMLVTLAYTTNYNLDLAGRHEAMTVSTMLAREKIREVGYDPNKQLKDMKGKFDKPFENYSFEVVRELKDQPILLATVPMIKIEVTVTGLNEKVTLMKMFSAGGMK